ncbi:MAG: hypothetical protein KJN64_09380 [Ignavibacteria bacterium]|nr:hypothetical protein [Ignavibacteria bacterium]
MKQQLILWISSIILTFVIGYIKNITDEHYPITGTFGIEGEKVSYKLDKVHYGNEPYKLIVLTERKELTGKCIWKVNYEQMIFPLKKDGKSYSAKIPPQKPLSKIEYKLVITHGDKVYEIPKDSNVEMIFFGGIPSSVNFLNFILLYGGILLAIKTTLEIFNEKKLIKKYAVITTSVFILLTAIINPLKNSYKLGAINNYVPVITEILEPLLFLLVLIWIVGIILIFYRKFVTAIASALLLSTVIIYFLLRLN